MEQSDCQQQIYTDATRQGLVKVQDYLNKLPLEQLGGMLSNAGLLKRSKIEKDRVLGVALYGQIMWAMQIRFDAERE